MEKILVSNEKKVTELLNSVQTHSKERTLDYEGVVKAVARIYDFFGIAKKYVDCKVTYTSHAAVFPASYRFKPQSTCISFLFTSGKVYITDCYRENCNKNHEFQSYKLSEQMREALLDKFMKFN